MKTEWILAVLVLLPFAAGLIACRKGRWREICVPGACVLELILILCMALGTDQWREAASGVELYVPEICGFGLYFVLDGFRLVYAIVTAFMWLIATAMSKEYFAAHEKMGRFYVSWLWTLGAVMGVFLSGDLYTTFLFFEIMSFTSYVWVVQEENKTALRAGGTYLAVAVIGGLTMLMGLFILYYLLGTLRIADLRSAAAGCGEKTALHTAGVCLLLGFGAKAGMFPLHIWLPMAHPVAPAPASALLSGVLTKTGIFGILVVGAGLFPNDSGWGSLVLILGASTMLAGAVLAIFSMDLKRTLACSTVSQIGFILVGIGMQGLLGEENALAVHGTALHMINHSLVKLILFLAAGVIYHNTHSLDLNRIQGFGRRKPLLAGIFLTGALCLAGVPGFGGYVSKTLLHESILAYGGGGLMRTVEAAFLFSGGLTAAYMTKLFVGIFVRKNRDEKLQEEYDGSGTESGEHDGGEEREKSSRKGYMSPVSGIALTAAAGLLLVWGFLPHAWMDRTAEMMQRLMGAAGTGHTVTYFSPENLRGAFISLGIGALVYDLFVRKLNTDCWPKWLDLERMLYRPVLLTALPAVLGVMSRILDCFVDAWVVVLRMSIYRDSNLPCERTEGNFLTAWLGRMMERIQWLENHTWRKKMPRHREYVHLAAAKYEEIRENSLIIQRSLSFGLLLFCLGLVLTLAYLIVF